MGYLQGMPARGVATDSDSRMYSNYNSPRKRAQRRLRERSSGEWFNKADTHAGRDKSLFTLRQSTLVPPIAVTVVYDVRDAQNKVKQLKESAIITVTTNGQWNASGKVAYYTNLEQWSRALMWTSTWYQFYSVSHSIHINPKDCVGTGGIETSMWFPIKRPLYFQDPTLDLLFSLPSVYLKLLIILTILDTICCDLLATVIAPSTSRFQE